MINLQKVTIHHFSNDSEKYLQIEKHLFEFFKRKFKRVKAKKTIPKFNLKKKSEVGLIATFNKKDAEETLTKLLENMGTIKESSITENSFSFGVSDYSQVSSFKFDISKPIFGFEATFFFSSKGRRISLRKRKKQTNFVNLCKKEDIINYMRNKNYEVL
jgi:ribosomal protein L5